MFEVGEKVVYGVIGACEVEEIGTPPIKGVTGDYYFLQPVYDSKGIIYSPVANTKVMIRSVVKKTECKKLMSIAKHCKDDENLQNKISPRDYDEYVKSQDPYKLMHLIRSLYMIRNERAKEVRKMKSADSRMLLTARKLLYGEMATSFEKDFSEVADKMDEYLGVD